MAIYKGYEVDEALYSVIRYMSSVQQHRDELQQQQISWDYLSVMAQLANLDNELSSARKQFNRLTGVLLNSLGLENLKKVVGEYGFKAQVSNNVLVRNLFERTADIGFLATDQAIRSYLSNEQLSEQQANTKPLRKQLIERFQEYVNKYSVYHDVILLDTQGRVMARLDESQAVIRSNDSLIKEALSTNHEYVEIFRPTDLFPKGNNQLIYAYRVESDVDQTPLGVVCLCFKLEDELNGVFKALTQDDGLETLVMLDKQQSVIASSRQEVIPHGVHVKFKKDQAFSLVFCNGKEYLCCASPADPYQGYAGPGWVACMLLPIDKAFINSQAESKTVLTPALLSAAMAGNLFDDHTKSIPQFANQIQSELNRSVWNGNVLQASEKNGPDAAVSKVLLSEIKNTGLSTKRIFEESVLEIQKTVLEATFTKSKLKASLAIDVMDRNLYERANDCRWWALNDTIRTLMHKNQRSSADINRLQSILSGINALYTVYTNILLFDAQGKVIAVSNPKYQKIVGEVQQAQWAKVVMLHTNTQQYAVSEFESTDLYDGRPSYIYSAAIRSPEDQKVIGGIGIVFDSEPQFAAILEDVVGHPALKQSHDHSFAVFTDKNKRIISTSNPDYAIGEVFDVDDNLLLDIDHMPNYQVMKIGERYYSVGTAQSLGYREFKSQQDQYKEMVLAFVCLDIGAEQPSESVRQSKVAVKDSLLSTNQHKTQLATFYVGDAWLGFRSEKVLSAVSIDQLVPIHGQEDSMVAGYTVYKGESITVLHTSMLMGTKTPYNGKINEAVVVRVGGTKVALTIDELGEMLDVDPMKIQLVGDDISVTSKVVKQVVLSNTEASDETMLQLLDVDLIAQVMQSVVLDAASAVA